MLRVEVDRRRHVAWTRAALDCLDETLETIAADSPDAAMRVLGVFHNAASRCELAQIERPFCADRATRRPRARMTIPDSAKPKLARKVLSDLATRGRVVPELEP